MHPQTITLIIMGKLLDYTLFCTHVASMAHFHNVYWDIAVLD